MLRIVRQVEFARHDENENSGDECPHSAELTRYLCRKLGVAGYALHCKGGGTIFLFEDRALATGFESAMFRSIAHEFATRASVPLKDLGMIEASAGFVSVWGGRAADWSASALPPQRQRMLWKRAAATGTFGAIAASAVPHVWVGRLGRPRQDGERPPH